MNVQPTSAPLVPIFEGMSQSALKGMICVVTMILIVVLAVICGRR